MPEGELWVPEGEAAIVCPHTKSRAAGRFEVPTEHAFLSTCSQRDKKFQHPPYSSRWLQGDNELSKNSNKVYYRKIVMRFLSCLFDRR